VRNKTIATLLASVLLGNNQALAQTTPADASLCTARGYAVVFFNGVWNSQAGAEASKNIIRTALGDTYGPNSEPVTYQLSYNQSGSPTGAINWQDLAETFEQRANTIDPTGNLAKHWEILWELLRGEESTIGRIILAYAGAGALIDGLKSDIRAKLAGAIGSLTSSPPTAADYASSDSRMNDLALQKQKILLVAHSQGNLFLNHAYDHVVGTVGRQSIAAVHVAPASASTRGEYKLSSSDLVINQALPAAGGFVLSPNITMPIYADDWSGHKFAETYMNAGKEARAPIVAAMKAALTALVTPTSTSGNVGAFTVTLDWDGPGDVDLHVFEPDSAHVYYRSRQGHVGFLDTDNTSGFGPEHYYASCDKNVFQPGTYRIGVNNYYGATGRTATVQISSTLTGFTRTKRLGVGSERGSSGDGSPISVFSLVVTKDPATGKLSYAAN